MTQVIRARRRLVRRVLSRGRKDAFNLLFPPHCLCCGVELAVVGRPLLCADCCGELVSTDRVHCRRCALPIPAHAAAIESSDCSRCRNQPLRFARTFTLGVYRGQLRETVIRMKQSVNEALTMAVGQLAAAQFGSQLSAEQYDIVVPMPIHWTRRFSRGLNVSELLAEPIAAHCGLKPCPRALRCRRKTRKQGTLRPAERLVNVREAFAVSARYDMKGARVLLVDDVMTTGATASEVAKKCRQAGAAEVHVAIIARGIGAD